MLLPPLFVRSFHRILRSARQLSSLLPPNSRFRCALLQCSGKSCGAQLSSGVQWSEYIVMSSSMLVHQPDLQALNAPVFRALTP